MATRFLINNLQAEDVFLQTQIDQIVAGGSLAGVAAKVKVGATTAMLSVDNTDPVIPKIDINVALPPVNGCVLTGNTNGSLAFSSEAPILNVASSITIDVIENPANIPPVPTDIQVKLAVAEPDHSGQSLITSLGGVLSWEDRVKTILPKVAFGITPFLSVDSTDPLEPVIDLNVGLPAVSGMSLNANTNGTLFWEERLQSINANQQPTQTSTYLTLNKADPENNLIDLNVGLPASNGQVLSALTNGTLSWITDTGAGVESISPKQIAPSTIPYLSVDLITNPAIPIIGIDVGLPSINNQVLTALTTGALSWSLPATKQIALTGNQQVSNTYQYVLGSNAPLAKQRISGGSLNINGLSSAYGTGRLKVSGSICLKVLSATALDATFYIGTNTNGDALLVMPLVYNTTSAIINQYVNVSFNSIYDNAGSGSLFDPTWGNADLYCDLTYLGGSPPSGNMYEIIYRSLQFEWLPLADA